MLENNIIKLHYSRGVSDKAGAIIGAIKSNKNILLKAPMKGGKTHLQINSIAQEFNPQGIVIIGVAPYVSLIEQVSIRGGVAWDSYTSKHKAKLDGSVNIETTPESYPNVINGLEERGIKFITIVDEAHTVQGMKSFRESFGNIPRGGLSPNCISTIYMTATSQILEKSRAIKFDKVIELVQDLTITTEEGQEIANPHIFKHGEEFLVHSMIGNSEEIARLTIGLANKYQAPVIAMINDKQLIEDCIDLIGDQVPTTGITSNNNPIYKDKQGERIDLIKTNSKELYNSILRGELLEGKRIIFVTSCLGCGIEIQNTKDAITLDLISKSYNFIDNIQFTGRNRNGVRKHILILPKSTESNERETTTKTYEEYYKDALKCLDWYKVGANIFKEQGSTIEEFKQTLKPRPYIRISDTWEVELDELILEAHCGKQYLTQNKHDQEETLKLWREESNLNFTTWGLFNEELPSVLIGEEQLTNLELNKALRQEEQERAKLEIINIINNSNESILKDVLEGELDLIATSEETLTNIIEGDITSLDSITEEQERDFLTCYYELIKNDSQFRDIIESLKVGYKDEARALKVLANNYNDKKRLKAIQETIKVLTMSKIYNYNIDHYKELTSKAPKRERVAWERLLNTRLYFDKRGLKRGAYITKEHLSDLIEIYANLGVKLYVKYQEEQDDKKKKALAKKIAKDLRDYLGQVFIINDTEIKGKTYIRYLSIRTGIEDIQ